MRVEVLPKSFPPKPRSFSRSKSLALPGDYKWSYCSEGGDTY